MVQEGPGTHRGAAQAAGWCQTFRHAVAPGAHRGVAGPLGEPDLPAAQRRARAAAAHPHSGFAGSPRRLRDSDPTYISLRRRTNSLIIAHPPDPKMPWCPRHPSGPFGGVLRSLIFRFGAADAVSRLLFDTHFAPARRKEKNDTGLQLFHSCFLLHIPPLYPPAPRSRKN